MASKVDILNKSVDAGIKQFRFTLRNASEPTLVTYHAPEGWDEFEIQLVRHERYHSVLRKASQIDLTFYKEGKKYLQDIYEAQGIDAEVSLTVEKYNKATDAYEIYPAPNKIVFTSYNINEIGVTVGVVDDGFKEKLFNRETTEVDVLKRVSVEGLALPDFSIDTIIMPDTSISLADQVTVSGGSVTTIGTNVVPIGSVTNTDFPEIQVPTGSTPGTKAASFFLESTRPRYIKLAFDIYWTLRSGDAFSYTIYHINSASALVNEYGIKAQTFSPSGDYNGDFQVDRYVTLNTGDSLIFHVTFNGASILTTGTIDVTETYPGSPSKNVKALLDYEVFLRILEIITDTENPLYSTFFGRTDTPLTTYPSDGELGGATKGIYMRSNGTHSATIPISLEKYFDAKTMQFRLGLGVEKIGGVDKVRIEEMNYFYSAAVTLDISSKLREQDIEKAAMPERYYKSIEFGYKKFLYERNDGLLEFNTKSTWTTYIKAVFNEYKRVNEYRADGQGMILLLSAPYETDYDPNEDFKGDDDIFLIDLIRDGSDFVARRDEGFAHVGGAVYASQSFNIRWSPARCLRKWGSHIKAGLTKSLLSVLRWQSTDKNTTLESRLTTEANIVYENADIPITELQDCIWLPEAYKVSVPLTTAQLNTIEAAPNGLIKLADNKYGWILECKTKNKDGKTDFVLLRANLTYITPA